MIVSNCKCQLLIEAELSNNFENPHLPDEIAAEPLILRKAPLLNATKTHFDSVIAYL